MNQSCEQVEKNGAITVMVSSLEEEMFQTSEAIARLQSRLNPCLSEVTISKEKPKTVPLPPASSPLLHKMEKLREAARQQKEQVEDIISRCGL